MEIIYFIIPRKIPDSFAEIVKKATENCQLIIVKTTENLPALKNKKIIFAFELDEYGFDIPSFKMLLKLKESGDNFLLDSRAIIIIQSSNELFTKSTAQKIILFTSQIGCRFLGHPVVEATDNLNIFIPRKKLSTCFF